MKEPNIEKTIVYKCDCGHYHKEDECEFVLIKILKGKNCPMNDNQTFFATPKENAATEPSVSTINTPTGNIVIKVAPPKLGETPAQAAKPAVDPDSDLNNPNAKFIKTVTPEEKAKYLKENAIPLEFLHRINPLIRPGMNIPNGDPAFESRGAKEIRRV